MRIQGQFKKPEQLNLYHPPLRLPRWKEMPSEVRQDVIRLILQMLNDHYNRVHFAASKREVEDE